jgi:SAM-dependent methyltransferase
MELAYSPPWRLPRLFVDAARLTAFSKKWDREEVSDSSAEDMNFLEGLQSLSIVVPGRSEADIQSDVKALLIAGEFLPDKTPLLETQTSDGTARRIDIEYGALVIECKRKLDHVSKAALAVAEHQLEGYLKVRQQQSGGLYAGMLTDGPRWRHYRLGADNIIDLVSTFELEPNPTEDRTFRDWLGSALPTETTLVPTAQSIAGRLGAQSPAHEITTARLNDLLAAGQDLPEVALKEELWGKLLRTAFGTQFEGTDLLFVEHTYLVMLATLIARAVLGLSPTESATRLLSGESFAEAGITGVGEAGFFDWTLDVPGGDELVADMARRVACFDWTLTDHDILKALYQSVISPEVRHRLGEYYTPDWLADRVVIETVTDPLNQRVLDPACGSGTFLFAAITRYFEAAEESGKNVQEAVDELPGHVAGIDLHPVAVALAQVTYLLAAGARLAARGRPFAVPVYLGDSMRWDDASTGAAQLFQTTDDVVVHTTDGVELFASELRFPASVVGRPDFDALVGEMTTKASNRKPRTVHPSIAGVLAKYVSHAGERATLEATYELLCTLHDEGRDHIWGYFVRNQARPAWFAQATNRVDVLVGNPPWLSYRYMPAEMQARFQERSKARNLWSGGKVATHQDLSAFFVARSVELYLKPGGKFAMVTPFAVLSRQSYQGFRTGRWTADHGPQLYAQLETPWSLLGIKPAPFPVPSAVVKGTRSKGEVSKPLPSTAYGYTGRAAGPGRWSAVAGQVTVNPEHIVSLSDDDESGSEYRKEFRQGATLVPRMLVLVEEGPSFPFMTSDQRSVKSRRAALEKEPWKSLPGLEGAVETHFVRNVLLGESIVPFGLVAPLEAIIPYTAGTGLLSGTHPKVESFPGFASWWQKAEEAWNEHKGAKSSLSLLERLDYMHNLESQFPTAPTRVVYTASGTKLVAALVTDGSSVIEHNLYWAAVPSLAAGRYLCGVLNAPRFTDAIEPFQSQGAFGARHFDKYVWLPPTPIYEPSNPLHTKIAVLAEEAETIASEVEIPAAIGFQAHRRLVRDALADSGVSDKLDQAVVELLHLHS